VPNDRLTRQELSWLLAQEARGAAKALREGVTLLKQPELRERAAPVETTLDALDDAIGKLTELQAGPRGPARRGRIDLAALLCEVAPNARMVMEPGAGTEVFGEEAELRRMLYVLVNQTNSDLAEGAGSASPEVRIRRDNELVKISVELGPDASATAELERRWLSRMATRHGGRLELEGGLQTVFLPADGSGDQVTELRKELEQAQQLGEAYARELAAAFAAGDIATEATPSTGSDPVSQRFEVLRSVTSAFVRPMRSWLEAMRRDAALALESLGDQAALSQSLARRANAAQEVLAELRRVAECPLDEPVRKLDVALLARDVTAAAEARAARHGVLLSVSAADSLELGTRRALLSLLLRAMLDHAILATPRAGTVVLHVHPLEGGVELITEDGGPSIPEAARSDLLRNRVDPSGFGRPAGLSLMIADAAAAYLGTPLTLGESPARKTETRTLLKA